MITHKTMKQEEKLHSNPPHSKITSIQVLRAIAAMIVAIYHSRDLVGSADPFKAEIDFLFNSGPAGVPLFFVISGFIMVYISREITSSPIAAYRFIVKRLLRIWPTYAAVTSLFYLIHHGLSTDPRFLYSLIQSLLFIPASNLAPPFYGTPTLSVGWTLNYEIYFYLLVAVSLFFSRFRWHVFFLIICFTLVIIPLTFGYLTFKPDRAPDFGFRYLNLITNPIIWNFVYGVAVGLIYNNPTTFGWFSFVFSRKSMLIAISTLVIWQYLSGFFGGFGPFQWGLGAVALFTAFVFYNAHRPVRFPSWLVRLGDISFSVYLLHIPVIVALKLFFHKIGYPAFESGTAMFILTISMTVVISNLSYEYLEMWLSNNLKAFFPNMKTQKKKERVNVGT